MRAEVPGQSPFTFAAGNARKVLSIPLYAVGQLAASLTPRDPRAWVVGSGFGLHDGALALAAEVTAHHPDVRLTWLTRHTDDEQRAVALGLPHVRRDSLRGWWRTLRAGVVVATHGFGDVNRYAVHGAVVVQLWHGAPLKRLHLDSPVALSVPVIGRLAVVQRLLRGMYARGTSRISLLPVSSEAVVERLSSAFALPAGHVVVLGEPRTDVLFADDEEARRLTARARLEASVGDLGGATVLLYAPTWRDGHPDPAVPTPPEWSAIAEWLETHDAVLLVRQHHLGAGRYANAGPRVRLLTVAAEPEVNAVLWAVDLLVTDYSSVLFDFAVTGRPIVFFAPDVATYERSRGFYQPYAELSRDTATSTWDQTLACAAALLADGPSRDAALALTAELATTYHHHTDGQSARRVVQHVLSLAGAGSAVSRGAALGAGPRTELAAADTEDAHDAVFFESFYGRTAACNPLAIDREIARRRPEARRFWSVAHPEVEVPVGARAVLVDTPRWRAARDEARLVVVNDWIRDDWRPRRDQTVFQTWHGTPLKRIALGRKGLRLRERAAVVKQSSRWSMMLAQGSSAARVLRRSYAVRPAMWVEGYPRNDEIVTGRGADVRERLGVTTPWVVLYAPTWRDGDLTADHLLDVSAFADQLGDDWTVLVRGHARTMLERCPTSGRRIIDVTAFPDASPLLATADVLVTDYSSVMFDFSAGGRPMVFFVPDLADYADHGRGVYWDLADRAPGPLVTSTAECARQVLEAGTEAPRWRARYAAWRAEFNPLDDGHAAERVVDRLQREGLI